MTFEINAQSILIALCAALDVFLLGVLVGMCRQPPELEDLYQEPVSPPQEEERRPVRIPVHSAPQPTVLPVKAPTREEPTLTELLRLAPVPAASTPALRTFFDWRTGDELVVLYGEPFRRGNEIAN